MILQTSPNFALRIRCYEAEQELAGRPMGLGGNPVGADGLPRCSQGHLGPSAGRTLDKQRDPRHGLTRQSRQ